MRFPSKVDGWIIPVLLLAFAGVITVLLVEDIVDIRPTRNPLSAPALSMDRLKISYGTRKFVLVSPSKKEGSIAAVEQARPGTRSGGHAQE